MKKARIDQVKPYEAPGSMESVYLAPHEGREIINKTNKPVTMLVVVNY